jgi:hypothetical protein
MAQHNSLMEWLQQTKRVSKSVDSICMKNIDAINRILPFLKAQMIRKNKIFFDRFCNYYHKPNPIDLIKGLDNSVKSPCLKCKKRDCIDELNDYVQESIDRCWVGIEMVQILWFEIIDWCFERPELVSNLALIDEYVQERIAEVCQNNKKINPLTSDIRKKFGRFWKGDDNKWHPERRKRF